MLHKQDYRTYQRKLAHFCRTNEVQELPGTHSPERVDTYRSLVFNVVETALGNAYPIAQAALGEREWGRLVHSFFAHYPCQSPQLWQMPYGLVEYVEETNYGSESFPFLKDLLNFEWIEIEVYMMEDIMPAPQQSSGDVLDDQMVLNPAHRITPLQYPVFRLSADELSNNQLEVKKQKNFYILLTYRHPETLRAHFSELSPSCLHLLQLIERDGYTGQRAVEETAKAFRIENLDVALTEARSFLEQLVRDRVILGFRKVA